MSDESFHVRTMDRNDMGLALDWAATEGWNPGLHDVDCFYAADPKGFLIGELDGEPISSISAVAYGKTFGFIGFYIVKPEFRGRRYGIRTWQSGMEYLAGRNIGLDGVVAQQANYRKSGFELAYRNIRHGGVGGGAVSSDVVDAAAVPFDQLLEYDTAHFPAPRAEFLRCWITRPDGAACVAMSDGDIAGYGVVRACRKGFKIGPLFANSETCAETLFAALAARAAGEPLYLDTPEANPTAVALAERHGMKPVFETARMYTKGAPDLPMEHIFGVTSFELG